MSQPSTSPRPSTVFGSVNWLLVVLCVVVVIVTSFSLFYWNRLFGWVVGSVLRALYWKSNNVWVEFDAIQISILSGRLLIKELRYHSTNQSIRIVKFHITCRYWLWRTRELSDDTKVVGEDIQSSKRPPCLFKCVAEGMEWFIYNRTPAYDDILKHMTAEEHDVFPPLKGTATNASRVSRGDQSQVNPSDARTGSPRRRTPVLRLILHPFIYLRRFLTSLWPSFEFGDYLPVAFQLIRGAIMIGNRATPVLLIGKFNRAEGTFQIVPARCHLDPYKQVYAFKFREAKIYTRVNRDFDRPMLEHGNEVINDIRKATETPKNMPVSSRNFISRKFRSIASVFWRPFHLHESIETNRWQGLSRYFTQLDTIDRDRSDEYARWSTLLETPIFEMSYYWDVPGLVPINARPVGTVGLEAVDIGNGDLAPQWGMDFVLHGGLLNYGPWADRQRRLLQDVFAPNLYRTRSPTPWLRPGQTRLYSALKIFFELKNEVTLRIPIREVSKNWRYDVLGDLGPAKRSSRPFGWLDVKIGADSTVNYVMSMVASESGYDNLLQVHADNLTVFSSVNQSKFIFAESCRVLCEMPAPLQWNARREWAFDVSLSKPTIYLLRDHITLLTDMAKDWTMGPPTEYTKFVPMVYVLRLALHEFHLCLNVNDHNVIDFPLSDQHNALVNISGQRLSIDMSFPYLKYRPLSSTVAFRIKTTPLDVSFTLPSWNTHVVLGASRTINIGSIDSLSLDSYFLSHAEVRPDNVDALKLNIKATGVLFKAYGWAVRQLMVVRDNYFGGFTNFATRTEYLDKMSLGQVGDPMKQKYRPGQANMLQVTVSLDIQSSAILLPRELHDCRSATCLKIPKLQLILNTHDYFMELTLNIFPLSLAFVDDCSGINASDCMINTQGRAMAIDGIDINAHRLFGPPPLASTYFCTWEFKIGPIHGSSSLQFLTSFYDCITVLKSNMKDILNAPATEFRLDYDPDVTFLTAQLQSVDLVVMSEACAIRLILSDGVRFDSNDLAGHSYRRVKSLEIPTSKIQCLLANPANKELASPSTWLEVGSAAFDVYMDIYDSPDNWRKDALRQMRFIQTQDSLTRRVPFLYEDSESRGRPYQHLNTLLLPFVTMPRVIESDWDSDHESILSFSTKELSEVLASSDSGPDMGAPHASLKRPPFYKPNSNHQGIRNPFTDENISSGDESDNDDYTKFDSETDFEDCDNFYEGMDGALSLYRRMLSKFELVKDSARLRFVLKSPGMLLQSHAPSDPIDPSVLLPQPERLPEEHHAEAHHIHIRLESRRRNEFMLTPLMSDVVCSVLRGQPTRGQYDPLEHLLDNIFMNFLTSHPARVKYGARILHFDARLVSWRIHLWQVIQKAQGLSVTEGGAPFKPSTIVSLVELTMRHGFLEGSVGPSDVIMLNASVGDLHFNIRGGSISMLEHLIPSSVTVAASSSNIRKAPQAITMSVVLGNVDIQLDDRSPGISYGTILEYTFHYQRITKLLSSQRKNSLVAQQSLVHTLFSLVGQDIADPLSRIQVSFMLTSGVPQAIRSDPSLYIFARLHQNVRSLTPTEKAEILDSPLVKSGDVLDPNELRSEFISVLEEKSVLGMLDLDPGEISGLRILDLLFPAGKEDTSSPTPSVGVTLLTRCWHVSLENTGPSSTELLIDSVDLQVRSGVRELGTSTTKSTGQVSQSTQDAIIMHNVLHLGLSEVKLNILPTSLPFVISLLRLRSFRTASLSNENASSTQLLGRNPKSKLPTLLEAFLDIQKLNIQTSAQLLNVDFQLVGAQAGSILLMQRNGISNPVIQEFSSSVNASFKGLRIQAKTTEQPQAQSSERAVLAEFQAREAGAHAGIGGGKLRITAGLQYAGVRVPRSAIKLYHFVKEWEAEYLPAYNATFKGLLSEMEKPGQTLTTPSATSSTLKDLDVQATLGTLSVSLHVMHGAWFAWSIYDSLAFGRTLNAQTLSYGIHIASQAISISSTDLIGPKGSDGTPAVKLELPPCRLSGVLEGTRIHAFLLVNEFKLMLKPKYVDDILTVQQKFGSDFNDLVDLISGSRTNLRKKAVVPHTSLSLLLDIQSKGFSIGLRGPSSVQYLEAPLIKASIRIMDARQLRWLVEAKGLKLSLMHDRAINTPSDTSPKPYISAYMTLDCTAHNETLPVAGDATDPEHLTIKVDRVHALMMPAAISELGNLIDHVQAEMLLRKEQRSLELEEMKKKTQRLLQSFESHSRPQQRASPFVNRIMSFSIRSIGIMFPLSLGRDGTEMPLSTSTDGSSAFLFSVAAVDFVTKREETGSARMQHCAFQFIPSFDRSNPKHFESGSHGTRDCLLYPETTVEVISRVSASSRKVLARAAVSGFELDVSPALPGYVFSMVDAYQDGMERFSRFVPQPRDEALSEASKIVPIFTRDPETSEYPTLPTSSVKASFEFQSGRVRFHAPPNVRGYRRASSLPHRGEDYILQDFTQAFSSEEDIFDVPSLSLWVEYLALPATTQAPMRTRVSNGAESRLTFNAVLHSSKNTIRPSILPFVTETTRQIEERLASQPVERRTSVASGLPVTPNDVLPSQSKIIQATELTFNLSIDESQFELTCLPDVNVLAGVHWKSGGFLLRITPGAREFGLVGSVENLTMRLRHGYLVEDCLNASARNLTFSVDLRALEEQGNLTNHLSIIAGSEIDGSVRFGRLQDVLCFNAVWLDRIPVLDVLAKTSPAASTTSLPTESVSSRRTPLVTSVLVQLETIHFEVDLGHAITKVTLDLRPVVLRTRLSDDFSEISFTSEEVKLDAVRSISGQISLPSISFETVRRRHTAPDSQGSALLELLIHLGGIHASLNYEGKKVLLLRCDPVVANVFDDWDKADVESADSEPHVRLNFAVNGGDMRAAARIMLISELILVGGKVSMLLRSQKEGAARESKTFRARQVPKPQNPLSQVASAMIESAKSKFKETGRTKLIIIQEMHLRVARLRMAIFSQSDTKMTQFEAINVQGDLLRNVQTDQPPFRALDLALHSFEVRGCDMPSTEKWLDFYSGAKVFTMPEMNISMRSTEFEENNRLEYDFRSTFPRPQSKSGSQSLYIALDFQKYEQLMAMQSALKQEIERALAELVRAGRTPTPRSSGSTEVTPLPVTTGSPPSVSLPGKDLPQPDFGSKGSGSLSPSARTISSAVPNASQVGIRGLTYHSNSRVIETPKLQQLGAASPDLETFKQWTNISIRDSLPVWVHEYATVPIEQLMKILLEVYLKQLKK